MGKPNSVSPAKRKRIIAEYAECRNYSEVGRRYGLSVNTIKRIVQRDPKSAKVLNQKAEEQTQDAIQYLTSRNAKMYALVDKLIDGMDKKATDIDMFTTIDMLAKTFGIVTDKLVKLHEMKNASSQNASGGIINTIIEAVKNIE